MRHYFLAGATFLTGSDIFSKCEKLRGPGAYYLSEKIIFADKYETNDSHSPHLVCPPFLHGTAQEGRYLSGYKYTLDHIRKLAKTDYENAMHLVDEGLRSGQISAFDANSVRANLTYLYTEDYTLAANYMRRALEQEEAQDPGVRSVLLYHLCTIFRNARDYTALLSTCVDGKECARMAGKRFVEVSFDFLAGNCLFDLGEEKTGLEMMRDALGKASAIAGTEQEYGHLVYFTGQLINDLLEKEDYPATLKEISSYDFLVTQMEKKFPEMDASYLDRCRFYLDIKRAICQSRSGDQKAAQSAFESACSRDFVRTTGGKSRLVDFYAASGQPECILTLYREELPYTEADTVSRTYRLRISRLKEAYTNAGMVREAREYEGRYNALTEQIEEKERAEGTLVNAAKYDVQRYRFRQDDMESALRKNRIILILIVVGIFLASSWFIYLNEKNLRQHNEETAALEKSLQSIQRQVSIIADRSYSREGGKTPLSLEETLEDKQLYLDKSLTRENAAALLGVSPGELSRMLGERMPGMSFPDYIRSLRVRHALELLKERPDIPISELADQSGFYTVRTLQRSFHAITGKTPSEYAKELTGRKG